MLDNLDALCQYIDVPDTPQQFGAVDSKIKQMVSTFVASCGVRCACMCRTVAEGSGESFTDKKLDKKATKAYTKQKKLKAKKERNFYYVKI